MTLRALVVLALLALVQTAALSGQSLPVSPGSEVAQAKCVSCHQSDLIVSQQLSASAWDREVGKMERWGVTFAEGERSALLTYLAAHFGPRPFGRAGSALEAGAGVFRTACTSCHGDDLVTPQRLSEAAWGREVDKMVRWGAVVTPEARGALVAYLASTWGVNR